MQPLDWRAPKLDSRALFGPRGPRAPAAAAAGHLSGAPIHSQRRSLIARPADCSFMAARQLPAPLVAGLAHAERLGRWPAWDALARSLGH